LEQLRFRFQETRDKPRMSEKLNERISSRLKDEERAEHQKLFKKVMMPVPILSFAAAVLLVGFLLLPSLWATDTKPIATESLNSKPLSTKSVDNNPVSKASADTLISEFAANDRVEPVTDKSELAKKLGYDLNYLHLPSWRMNKAGIYKSTSPTKIARFDFSRNGDSGSQSLTCYQAPQNTIRANQQSESEIVSGKRVIFGSRGQFQFALWSQNGRDYLFVTALPKSALEEIVRGA
jgi:hypothetical protein